MKSIVFVVSMLMSLQAFAGGSITREEALDLIASSNPTLADAVSKLPLADAGEAVRAGSHTPNPGARLMPFTFPSKDGKLTFVIDQDEDGNISALVR